MLKSLGIRKDSCVFLFYPPKKPLSFSAQLGLSTVPFFGTAALCRDSIPYSNAKKQKLQVHRGKIGFILREKSV
ncbi:hypothetical protein D3Z39_10970 [Anaerotruncus colihominis]|jgi:hypothetical protein|uniref:Uncharacterized protein n=1 Tax=Anaerotruncus colihominis TaxID=169435 RepID=A0A845RHZ8_9FIRM|nr:hypothetical protein [Anaerotruncus colihominis]